eukprot:5684092-Amphidinium_carterae.3
MEVMGVHFTTPYNFHLIGDGALDPCTYCQQQAKRWVCTYLSSSVLPFAVALHQSVSLVGGTPMICAPQGRESITPDPMKRPALTPA